MKLTYDQALKLHQGLQALEKEKFECDDEKTPYRVGSNLNRLEFVSKLINKRRKQMLVEAFGHEGPLLNNDPKIDQLPAYNQRWEEFMESEIPDEIKILTVKRSDLKAKANSISGPTLAKLAPMISDWDVEETETKK